MFIYLRKFYSPDEQPAAAPTDPKPADPKPSDPKPEAKKSDSEIAKAYMELKKNSVSRDEYEKVVKEKDELIKSVIDGDGDDIGLSHQPKPKADIKAMREDLYGPKCSELSNLEFCQKTLDLRDAVIEQEGYDPFLPYGSKIKPNEEDVKAANNLAEVLRECIKEADGNSEVFTALLQSRTNNDSPTFLAKMRKAGH